MNADNMSHKHEEENKNKKTLKKSVVLVVWS